MREQWGRETALGTWTGLRLRVADAHPALAALAVRGGFVGSILVDRAHARGVTRFTVSGFWHGYRAHARRWWAFAPSGPRTHVRGHVWLRVLLTRSRYLHMTTCRKTVVQTGSPPTSHVSATNRVVDRMQWKGIALGASSLVPLFGDCALSLIG